LAELASSSPTIRNVCSLPPSRMIVTDVPNRTSEWSGRSGLVRGERLRAGRPVAKVSPRGGKGRAIG
jgi:hypothetical protein